MKNPTYRRDGIYLDLARIFLLFRFSLRILFLRHCIIKKRNSLIKARIKIRKRPHENTNNTSLSHIQTYTKIWKNITIANKKTVKCRNKLIISTLKQFHNYYNEIKAWKDAKLGYIKHSGTQLFQILIKTKKIKNII